MMKKSSDSGYVVAFENDGQKKIRFFSVTTKEELVDYIKVRFNDFVILECITAEEYYERILKTEVENDGGRYDQKLNQLFWAHTGADRSMLSHRIV